MNVAQSYNLEILAGTIGDLQHCPVACGGCPYAEPTSPTRRKAQFSPRATEMFQRTQQVLGETKQPFTVSVAGTPGRLDPSSFPNISSEASVIILSAGSFSGYNGSYESLIADIETVLSGKLSSNSRAPLLHVYFPDRNKDLPNNETYVLDQLTAYSKAFVNSRLPLSAGVSSSLSVAVSSNDLDQTSFTKLTQRLRRSSILRPMLPVLHEIMELDSEPEIIPEFGGTFVTESMQLITEGTYVYGIDIRGILQNETRTFDETQVNPYNITFYANKILLGHSSRTLLISPYWIDYNSFSNLLDKASEQNLDKLICAHFSETP